MFGTLRAHRLAKSVHAVMILKGRVRLWGQLLLSNIFHQKKGSAGMRALLCLLHLMLAFFFPVCLFHVLECPGFKAQYNHCCQEHPLMSTAADASLILTSSDAGELGAATQLTHGFQGVWRGTEHVFVVPKKDALPSTSLPLCCSKVWAYAVSVRASKLSLASQWCMLTSSMPAVFSSPAIPSCLPSSFHVFRHLM
eukprot:scaffold13740_cov22-Tisochrysis_lutea.AAC.4